MSNNDDMKIETLSDDDLDSVAGGLLEAGVENTGSGTCRSNPDCTNSGSGTCESVAVGGESPAGLSPAGNR